MTHLAPRRPGSGARGISLVILSVLGPDGVAGTAVPLAAAVGAGT